MPVEAQHTSSQRRWITALRPQQVFCQACEALDVMGVSNRDFEVRTTERHRRSTAAGHPERPPAAG